MISHGTPHPCGGVFRDAIIQIRKTDGGLATIFQVKGLRCSKCGDELISGRTAVDLDAGRISALKSIEKLTARVLPIYLVSDRNSTGITADEPFYRSATTVVEV